MGLENNNLRVADVLAFMSLAFFGLTLAEILPKIPGASLSALFAAATLVFLRRQAAPRWSLFIWVSFLFLLGVYVLL